MKISNQPSIGNNISKVDSAKNNPLDQQEGLKAKAEQTTPTKAETLSAASVQLSDKAQQMQKAKDVASSSTVDDAKVERLQKLIDSGDYKVNASALADKLVDEHLLMND